MNDNGDLMGGLVGSLKSMGYALRELKPTRCIVVFDGSGGSTRRRQIYPDYKGKRKNRIRVNRMYEDISTPDLEQKSMKEQLMKFVKYLNLLPVTTISVDHIEADDVIAFLATEYFKEPHQTVTIMSADKDFLQLVNERVRVWSPTKKKLYGQLEVLNEYGIHPKNFVLFRTLDGDESDNIDGVKGAGLKTVTKLFPTLADDKQHDLIVLKEISEREQGRYKLYGDIVEQWELVERNFKLMQLRSPDFANFLQLGILNRIRLPVKKMNLIEITREFTQDGIHSLMPGYNVWLKETFGIIDHFAG
jgi:5'-3' exonuclease